MVVQRSMVLIDPPLPAVAAAMRDVGVLQRAATGDVVGEDQRDKPGLRWEEERLFSAGDEIFLQVRLTPGAEQLRVRAEQLASAPAVAAAAIVAPATSHGRRVLAQQRACPAAIAGRWELPGGQVEPGESVRETLIRECREELAVDVIPGAQLGPDVPLPGGRVLRVHIAWLADPQAQPVPVEHAALRWVAGAELAELDWLDADRAVLADLELALRDP